MPIFDTNCFTIQFQLKIALKTAKDFRKRIIHQMYLFKIRILLIQHIDMILCVFGIWELYLGIVKPVIDHGIL